MKLEAEFNRIEGVAAAFNTHYEIFKYMKGLTQDLGMNAFLIMTLPTVDIVEIGATKIITNWPAEMVEYYDTHNLLIDSPVIRRMLSSTSPFNYDVEAINADRGQGKKSTVIELFNRYGMGKGAYFPVHDAAGGRGAMSISGPRNFSMIEMAKLLFIATLIYDRLSQLTLKERQRPIEFTHSELDCLRLTAGGKKGNEIAKLLDLSEHAVNNHISSVIKKLGCTSRTQAVVSALRLNIIRA
ncbi:LuxR family transcriptional regulator [Sinorhizobium americanum]|uniref:LuxR family transcriptional regulator n=1 Tax=Sinorhizobium americanum TaxID=194963 RepID=A0A1L3LP44_9HYPH|nr:LuxR family transcriptional regulator [Sinorhizobium americanum]APG85206.1 LuxR family transcriptional regulator [Sinorhizobium americanum CCGM7]APG91851.1 LuxR family transcriptional regulator [Sinorhizobium americanum]OAP47453.1 LuxR family transcriptional regulator [Sinorhizobium americanum]TCN29930.1 regulatory LuxR family protein [Sinorhizobium americanum]